ncbi:S26 family signal peptidase [Blastochloris sulfoviridis]|uniref:S26 family signal peptidase n=1 Tax=Blastochloris sulfoviridis TaxID=50712 RepID=A0A5M6I0P7_9HYPH|nr:S26 family signal peptidase [Blastochloris sulfoviridis]KAA5601764.1 S26 family signal peptidase [Blastochloris sulfoviridis]
MTRRGWLTATFFATIGIAIPPFTELPKTLIWNASASVPIGLYAINPLGGFEVTDLVVIEPPEAIASFLAAGGYVPRGVRLMKRVLALAGHKVCRDNLRVTVNGLAIGSARERDSRGRDLPVWQGCRTLRQGEVFLMNWQSSDSLDGRYFGPVPVNSIVGRATPLWTDEDGDGHFRWRAPTR